MEKSFNSLAELQAEIQLLKVQNFHNEEALKECVSSPSAVFHTITGLFKSKDGDHSAKKSILNEDLYTYAARVVIPFFMNGVLFKKSGFLAKMLITFLSQKAAKKVTSNTVSNLIGKAEGLFKNFIATKKRKAPPRDYGIPPDSESF